MSQLIAEVSGVKGSERPIGCSAGQLNPSQDSGMVISLIERTGENNPVIKEYCGQYGMIFRSAELLSGLSMSWPLVCALGSTVDI
ncbi:hypothetical protein [Pseudomonas protegens]|uniref:hypothetical protein n=1 Tax=Pseudomonas protegens TaxID=380021 RepID=UPI00276B2601|nr:hypothetical protein [Pseudomonas protegens]MDP9524952.1 hypothetical protein [Pseudomonas protegens]